MSANSVGATLSSSATGSPAFCSVVVARKTRSLKRVRAPFWVVSVARTSKVTRKLLKAKASPGLVVKPSRRYSVTSVARTASPEPSRTRGSPEKASASLACRTACVPVREVELRTGAISRLRNAGLGPPA